MRGLSSLSCISSSIASVLTLFLFCCNPECSRKLLGILHANGTEAETRLFCPVPSAVGTPGYLGKCKSVSHVGCGPCEEESCVSAWHLLSAP